MQALWMLVASFLFACMSVCVKLAALTHSAFEIIFYRGLCSLVFMSILVACWRVSLYTPHWRWHFSRGLVGFSALSCFFFAITRLPLPTAVTLNYTSAIFISLLLILQGTRINLGSFVAMLLGMGGVILLLQPTFQADQWLGGLVGLISGFLAAIAGLSVRELGKRGESEMRTVFYFAITSTVGAAVLLLFSDIHPVDAKSIFPLLGVGFFATIAQIAMTRAYSRGKPLVAAALAYSTVVFTSLFAMFLWDEKLDATDWLAVVLIIASGVSAAHFSRQSSAENST